MLKQIGAWLTTLGSLAVWMSFEGMLELALTFFFMFYLLRDRETLLTDVRALLLALARHWGSAALLTFWGVAVVGVADNLI